jgi:hypothetical protein
MRFHEVPWNSMRFYDVLVNRSVPTEANRGLTSYTLAEVAHWMRGHGSASVCIMPHLSTLKLQQK